MKILSLFANIGVAEAYLNEIGFEVVVANELDTQRAELYQKIYPNSKMICGDITTSDIYNKVISESKLNGVDVIMATPPCQGMSTAGQQKAFDERNNLFLYALNAIDDLKPKYFIFENVPAFLTTDVIYNGQVMSIPDVIVNRVASQYSLTFQLVNTQDYEVPQMRERVIVLATRNDVIKKWEMPEPSDRKITMQEAIGWIPTIDPFVRDLSPADFSRLFPKYEERRKQALSISRWNEPTSHVYRNVLAMQYTPTGCTAFNNVDQYKPRKRNGDIVRGFKNTYKRQNWDTPAYTIAMDNIEISSQNNVHPGRLIGKDENGNQVYSDARVLTLFELMIIMSIPKDWPIPIDTNPKFLRKVIGEGVPSLLIKKIFSQLK